MKKKKLLGLLTLSVIGLLLLTSISAYSYSNNLSNPKPIDERADDRSVPKDGDWYYKPDTYAELVSWYQALEANFSDHIEVFKANELYGTGQATGGYDLYYVRITNESRGLHKPEVLFLGGPHGDETVGTVGMYWFLDWFTRKAFTDEPCEDYSKEWLNWLVDNREIYFEVSHNPYGFDHGPQRYDGNGWDLNREADYDGPGDNTGGIWASENGQT
ncbi:MAG TPA: M14 family zinc carboxypeptidase, partial [Candidatus Thermoplasmatota archaeon]|nr:M14 family zinc carboxypeptidase [Candidatus Thermoplasmatota archaeon]